MRCDHDPDGHGQFELETVFLAILDIVKLECVFAVDIADINGLDMSQTTACRGPRIFPTTRQDDGSARLHSAPWRNEPRRIKIIDCPPSAASGLFVERVDT